MIAFKLALRNLIGAGLRTWLNVGVLAFILILITWHYGILDGWNRQAITDMIAWEVAGGQVWQENYDPYDPFTLQESHDLIPSEYWMATLDGNMTPILITQATIYPEGRMANALLKGIDPDQEILALPTSLLNTDTEEIPAIIGASMARSTRLQTGDVVTVRWRDVDGTFDATELVIAGTFQTNVPTVDGGQLWIPLNELQGMMSMGEEATLLVVAEGSEALPEVAGWEYQGHDVLMQVLIDTMRTKRIGGSVFYVVLMLLAMLAVFDTQVLSIFRRQREIGTYMAMGMTRFQVVRLFTVEGAMHSLLAVVVGVILGTPFLILMARKGMAMPAGSDDFGMAITEVLYPAYSVGLVLTTMFIVIITITLVSYLPARRISKMKPTEAIKGKLQ